MKIKYILGISSGFFFLIIFLFFLIIIVVANMFGSTNFSSSEMKIREEYLKQYEELQSSKERKTTVLIPIKYIYAMDGVKRQGVFRDNLIYVDELDLNCMIENSALNEDKKYINTCMSYSEEEIKLFNYFLNFYETLYGEDSRDFKGFVRPVISGTVTNEFGGYDAVGDGHTGIDISGGSTQVYPTAPGKVIKVFSDSDGGNQVTILHNLEGKSYVSNYAHLKKVLVNEGDEVDYDTQIGIMGQTGTATGTHLHFEIIQGNQYIHSKLENPRDYVSFPKKGEYWYARYEGIDIEGDKEKIMEEAGIVEEDYDYADYIITKESGWDYTATNPSSGAYGLCQALPPEKMETAGDDWLTNPVTQLKWCDSYAISRYGSWKEAKEFWEQNNWW